MPRVTQPSHSRTTEEQQNQELKRTYGILETELLAPVPLPFGRRCHLIGPGYCYPTSCCHPGIPNLFLNGKYFVHRFSGFRPGLLKSSAPTSGFLWTLFFLHLICCHGNCWALNSFHSPFWEARPAFWHPGSQA